MSVSIIITNYNYMRFLARAIRSCFLQTHPAEIIVVNDASTDESQLIIESFGGFIKPLLLPRNVGVAEARNIGVMHTNADFIAFLDADDCLHRDFVRIAMLNFEFGSADAFASDYIVIGDNDDHISRHQFMQAPIACGIMYQREHIVRLQGFNPYVEREDIDFAAKFHNNFKMGYTNLPLYRYRYHGKNSVLKLH